MTVLVLIEEQHSECRVRNRLTSRIYTIKFQHFKPTFEYAEGDLINKSGISIGAPRVLVLDIECMLHVNFVTNGMLKKCNN